MIFRFCGRDILKFFLKIFSFACARYYHISIIVLILRLGLLSLIKKSKERLVYYHISIIVLRLGLLSLVKKSKERLVLLRKVLVKILY